MWYALPMNKLHVGTQALSLSIVNTPIQDFCELGMTTFTSHPTDGHAYHSQDSVILESYMNWADPIVHTQLFGQMSIQPIDIRRVVSGRPIVVLRSSFSIRRRTWSQHRRVLAVSRTLRRGVVVMVPWTLSLAEYEAFLSTMLPASADVVVVMSRPKKLVKRSHCSLRWRNQSWMFKLCVCLRCWPGWDGVAGDYKFQGQTWAQYHGRYKFIPTDKDNSSTCS